MYCLKKCDLDISGDTLITVCCYVQMTAPWGKH